MTAQSTHTMDNNGKLRELIDDWAVAVRSKDIERIMAHYTSDVVAYDVVNPLEYKGSYLFRERLTGWLSSFQGAIGFEISNLEVEAGDYLAFCYSLNRVIGINRDGTKINMCWRATLCCRKIDGLWKIKHSHSSVPFDVETGLASLDLEP